MERIYEQCKHHIIVQRCGILRIIEVLMKLVTVITVYPCKVAITYISESWRRLILR